MECSYCKKTFSTRYVLINHQKTVKSCIKIQNELGIQNFCNPNIDFQSIRMFLLYLL